MTSMRAPIADSVSFRWVTFSSRLRPSVPDLSRFSSRLTGRSASLHACSSMLSYPLPLSSELEYCGVAFRFGGFEAPDLEVVLFDFEPDGAAEEAPSLARSDEPFGRGPPARG